MNIKRCITFLLFLQLLYSCRKKDLPAPVENLNSFNEVFDAFWNGMNTNYVYWDIDTTNWENMYRRYKPLFARLDLSDYADLQKSVEYFREMTNGLVDSHMEISFINAALSNSIINPALERKKTDVAFHEALSYFSIAENYLDPGYSKGSDHENNQGHGPLFALSGKIENRILYFGFNEFSLFRSYHSANSNPVKPVIDYFLENLRSGNSQLQGVILDIRNNAGGDLSDLNFLLSQFLAEPLKIGYFHTKRAGNPLDFTPWLEIIVPTNNTPAPINLPIIVLMDNYSASLAEVVAMAVHALPNASLIGEKTYGATGALTRSDVYNAGSFSAGNFLTAQLSSTAFKSIDNKSYEGKGFDPDIKIPFNADSVFQGIDRSLQEAIKMLK